MRWWCKSAAILLALIVGMPGLVRATTVTFDDLPNSGSNLVIPNGYGGLNWNNMYYLNPSIGYSATGYMNGVVSPSNVAYNGYGSPADVLSVSSSSPFTFNSAYFTGAWNDGLQVQITGYRNGIQVDQTTVTVNTSGPLLVTLDWSNIDDLHFVSSGGTAHYQAPGYQFVMDNFRYNEPAAVPEPSAMVLGLGGLGLLAVYRSRRRRGG